MTGNQIKATNTYALPLERLFSIDGMHKVLDCFLSNYELGQTIEDISKFTKLKKSKIEKCLTILTQEHLISKQDTTYKTKIASSNRLAGLFSYYRATMSENLKNLEFKTVSQ